MEGPQAAPRSDGARTAEQCGTGTVRHANLRCDVLCNDGICCDLVRDVAIFWEVIRSAVMRYGMAGSADLHVVCVTDIIMLWMAAIFCGISAALLTSRSM